MTKYHYKLSAKPIEPGCYVIFTKGKLQGCIHKVRSAFDGEIWQTAEVFPKGEPFTAWYHTRPGKVSKPLRLKSISNLPLRTE